MAGQFRAARQLAVLWPLRRPHIRRDRRCPQPVLEDLEGRVLLAGAFAKNLASNVAEPAAGPSSQQLGTAYQQVVSIQTVTLQSLGNSYREVQAAAAQLGRAGAVAITGLNAELTNAPNRREANAITAAIARDRHLLNQGEADVDRVEQGLDVARGVADQQANTDMIYIPNGLFTNLAQFVQQDQSTSEAIARSGRRATNTLVRKLSRLGDELASTNPEPTSAQLGQNSPVT